MDSINLELNEEDSPPQFTSTPNTTGTTWTTVNHEPDDDDIHQADITNSSEDDSIAIEDELEALGLGEDLEQFPPPSRNRPNLVLSTTYPDDSYLVMTVKGKKHTGTKGYPCNNCNKRFSSLWSLKRHVKTYNPKQPYTCDLCNKNFLRLHHLREHEMAHPREPYVCEYCNRTFLRERFLKTHVKTHIGKQL